MNYIIDSLYSLKQSISSRIPFLTPEIEDDICQVDPEITYTRSTIISCITPISIAAGIIFFTISQQRWFDFFGKLRSFSPNRIVCCKLAVINLTTLIGMGNFNNISSWLSEQLSQNDQNRIKNNVDQLAIRKIIDGSSGDDASQWLEHRPSAIEMLGEKVHSQCIVMLFYLNSMEQPLPEDCRRYVIAKYMELLKSRVKVTEEKIGEIFNTKL